jgi:serine/threonine-protein kinase RsbW
MDTLLIRESLGSRLELVPVFLRRAEGIWAPLGFSSDDLFKIKLAMEEALTNAIRHGNRLDPGLSVEVTMRTDADKLILEIKDQGQGFIPDRVSDPTTHENKDKPHGRGVYLMRSLMDRVDFEEGGRLVRLTKFIRKEN